MISIFGRLGAAAGVAAALLAPGAAARAEEFTGPISIVVPYSAGGGADVAIRALAPLMAERLGVEVVVANMPGAAGQKAAVHLARAAPDGRTLMVGNYPGVATPLLTDAPDAPYDVAAFTVVAQLTDTRRTFVTRADGPLTSLEDVLALDRPIKAISSGEGSTSRLVTEIFWRALDRDPIYITGYTSSAASAAAVLRGDGDVLCMPADDLARYSAGGDFRVLATLTPRPRPGDGPNGAVLGLPDLDRIRSLRVLLGPPGLPEALRDRLSEAAVAAASDPRAAAAREAAGVELEPLPAEAARAEVEALLAAYRAMMPRTN